MKTIENFCGQKKGYSRSITLRNRLIPIGKTEENIKKLKLLDNDINRSKAYVEVKALIDDFHRVFIEDVLSKVKLEWGPLYDQFDLFQNEKDKQKKNKIKKELETLQGAMRKQIIKKFKDDDRFDKLFKKELLTEFVPTVIKNDESGTISDKKAALDEFKGFATYFTGFHQNRQNMYSEEAKATAISNRIVNENFPKFYANVKFFEYLQEKFPEIISQTEQSLSVFLKGKKLADIFCAEGFNAVLSQSGIDFYNTIIGGVAGEAGTQKIQGLNEKINLTRQQLPAEEKSKLKRKMTVLYKQILSDRSTASFIPIGFESSDEVYESVKQFKEDSLNKILSEMKILFEKSDYELSQIYVPAKEVTEFSLKLFGNWSILHDGLFLIEKDNAKKSFTEKQIDILRKDIAKRDCSLADLQNAYERWAKENDVKVEKTVKNYFKIAELRADEKSKEKASVEILKELESAFDKIDFEKRENLIKEKESATPIKDFLDEVQNLYHYLKLVDYRGEEQKDTDFYSKFDEILQTLSEIVPLYNKVRNFVTKKPNEVKKVKLNFDCPTLASGWDLNKESSNDAIILRKNGNFYLGIFNSKDKPKFENRSTDGEYYEKMIYKLLPGPNKMLPKVFFSTKGQETFLPPKEILLGYEEGKHKKDDNFDKDFMYKLIDWFKYAINQHEDWKMFNFKFSPTETYEDLSGFYKEVEAQGYKITFQKVAESYINSLVDAGKLFLFQIYNKDYSTGKDGGNGSTGKKNLHTMYWENLFSEENLRDVCLKLNGDAELFWRDANPDVKAVCHGKGSVLVNRTTSDGKTIPEEIYQEIYKFKNPDKQEKDFKLSDAAKELLDSGKVVCKEAKFDITKDRHFTQKTYLLHCPITMNFKAPEITGRKFNEKLQEVLKNNPDVKIIGLDRGERHLIYLSLINQKGEIELQKTLNLVEQVRNDKTVSVNYQEKLVQKEGERDKARKNWQTISNIKELKEGYLSNIVHEIAKLMVENNAIVVMEDLNFGFKRGRFAVERQVYQKFENMLIEKLNYLVFKDKKVTEPGGVLNAYQLTDKSANVSDVGKQCGWIFYIPAGYTSKIDPKTGFANLFYTAGLTNIEKKKEFFDKFDSIRYDGKTDSFVFSFDYSEFGDNADFKKKWEVYSKGERLVFSKSEKSVVRVNPTENLKALFDKQGINWNSEDNFIDQIQAVQGERENCAFYDGLYRSFTAILQMRNSVPNSSNQEDDYLISPVMAEDGSFYDSREEAEKGKTPDGKWISKLPVDADANGAYHIALKGLYLLKNNFNLNEKGYIENISNADWFKFVQEKDYAK
ncbi:MAG: type V CRISPR-associated protein Cas12a/Cpf1 [Treponemataceae bacterium]|nr:type V CRISPR-associated protein Cas12a/Cpf1 [Treponemataceae bacterium]